MRLVDNYMAVIRLYKVMIIIPEEGNLVLNQSGWTRMEGANCELSFLATLKRQKLDEVGQCLVK